MDKELTIHNVEQPTLSVQTLEEYELLLADYKKANPEKFALKVANGEFDKMRVLLGGGKVEEPVAEEPVAEEKPRGRKPKEKE